MSAFNNLLDKTRDRNWGGTNTTVACEPYISGYSFIQWKLPDILGNYLDQFLANITNDQTALGTNKGDGYANSIDAGAQLDCACMSVTPPSGTLNKVQFQGLGGSKWSVPGSIDYGNTITLKYLEFSGIPIARLHRAWCNMIRDNKIGLTALKGSTTTSKVKNTNDQPYNKSNYSATLLYWTTKPDGVTVEYYAAYSGVFPLKDPLDTFTGDINSVDKLEIDIDYNVDMIWHEDWVYEMCQTAAKGYGMDGRNLWSRDGFRYQGQNTYSMDDTPSKL